MWHFVPAFGRWSSPTKYVRTDRDADVRAAIAYAADTISSEETVAVAQAGSRKTRR